MVKQLFTYVKKWYMYMYVWVRFSEIILTFFIDYFFSIWFMFMRNMLGHTIIDMNISLASWIDIVDKTASFVARNGPEFESRIRKNELNNAKFNFLNPSDPYHAYYQHKVREFKEGRGGYWFYFYCKNFQQSRIV